MPDIAVPALPLIPSLSAITTGRTVRASTWSDMANLGNLAIGAGSVLVPETVLTSTLTTSVDTYRFRAKTRLAGKHRLWCFTFNDNPGNADGEFEIVINGGTPVIITIPPGSIQTYRILEEVSVPALADTELVFTIQRATGSSALNLSVTVFELPRATIDTATEAAVDVSALRPRGPIYDGATLPLVSLATDVTLGRRTGMFHWAVPSRRAGAPITTFARSNSTTTFADVLDLGVPMLARARYRGETTRTLRARFYGWVSVGTATLEVQVFTSRLAATSATVTTSSTTPVWLTELDFTVDCEDLSTSDGLQSATFDLVDVKFRRTGGAGTAYITNISIFEN
jgi:hypothetical protein